MEKRIKLGTPGYKSNTPRRLFFLLLLFNVCGRAVAAYLKVVRRRESSSADGTSGGEHVRVTVPLVRGLGGLPQENFEFLALLCAFLMGFYAFGTRLQTRFFDRKDISWRVIKPNAKQNRFQIVTIIFYFFLQHIS